MNFSVAGQVELREPPLTFEYMAGVEQTHRNERESGLEFEEQSDAKHKQQITERER